jgi:hypothetical protein
MVLGGELALGEDEDPLLHLHFMNYLLFGLVILMCVLELL